MRQFSDFVRATKSLPRGLLRRRARKRIFGKEKDARSSLHFGSHSMKQCESGRQGEEADERALQKPFSDLTRWRRPEDAVARGRYYVIVEFDGKSLGGFW